MQSSTKGLIHIEKYDKGEHYEIAYRCLVNEYVKNMLTIGRCISTTFLVQSSIKIRPTVIDMGGAAGKAYGYALKQRTELSDFHGKNSIDKIRGCWIMLVIKF